MDFRFSEAEERFREEVRTFIKENLTKEAIADSFGGVVRGPHSREMCRKMARAGLFGLSWPKEYGGKELPSIYDYHINDELAYSGGPQVGKGVGIVGRTLMDHGSDFLKELLLREIIHEDVQIAVGYTEPDAGSDLASLRIRAVEDGDDYVVNGEKMFCSAAHCAEWIWLLVRTDPNVPKHKGISLFLVDVNTPGITVREIKTMSGDRTNEVFFDDVRVSKKFLVGKLNGGWKLATEALAYERYCLFPAGAIQAQFDRLLKWVREAEVDGKPLAKDPLVRHKIARLAIQTEVVRMYELRLIHATEKGEVGVVEAAMLKLAGSHLEQRIADTAMDIMGPYGVLMEDSKHVRAEGFFEFLSRFAVIRTIGGGASEIQKNIIAKRLLGLPS